MPSENKRTNWREQSAPDERQDQAEFVSDFLSEESVPINGVQQGNGSSVSEATGDFVDPDATEQIFASSNADTVDEEIEKVSESRVVRPHPLSEGAVLVDRYVIQSRVAQSSTGDVYKALDRQRESAGDPSPWVALKVAGGDNANNSASLRDEYLTLLRLRHPNVVAVYDFRKHDDIEFIVLEWLSGQTLAGLLESIDSERLAQSAAKNIVVKVTEALAHAHAAGVVHGDVKPSNVFVTEDHSIKLIDFGAASSTSDDSGTDRQSLWATKAYASCEVLRGNSPQPADDVFSLGVTAYRLFSGAWPFGETTAFFAKQQNVVVADLADDALGCEPAIRQALQFDSIDRPSDANAFLLLLHDETDDSEAPVRSVEARTYRPAVAWGGVMALALGLVAILLWPEPEPAPNPLDGLLASADEAFVNQRFIEPVGDGAVDRYQAVLAMESDNSTALRRLDEIAEHFLDRARTALIEEQYREAITNLEEARRVSPDHMAVLLLDDLVGNYQGDLLVGARRLIADDVGLADQYAARAAALTSEEDPAVLAVRRDIRRQIANAELEALIRTIDERILSERLLVPRGDSALVLLNKAREMAPDDWQVELAADRITSALLFQAWFATSNGNFDAAQSFIDAAASLDVRHLALARAKYQLVRARNDVSKGESASKDRDSP